MEEKDKKIDPIAESKVSDIQEFGKTGNILVLETIGTFRNMMNLIHKPREKERYIEEKYLDGNGEEKKREIRERQAIYYPFEESPEFEFMLAQAVKLQLEGKEVDLTANNLVKFFNREPQEYRNVQRALNKHASDMGFLRR